MDGDRFGRVAKPLKIATLVFEDLPTPPILGGAIEIIVEELCSRTQNLEWSVYSKGVPSLRDHHSGKRHYFYFQKKRPQALLYCFRHLIPEWAVYPHWIAAQIKKQQVDVVLVHNEILYLPYVLALKKMNPDLKILIYFHNDKVAEYPRPKQLAGIFKNVDGVIGVSHYILKQFSAHVPNYPQAQQFCIHNASHLAPQIVAVSKKIILRKKYKISPQSKVILFVGRLTAHKGAYWLMKALRFFNLDADYRFIFVGSSHHGKDFIEPEFLNLKNSLPKEIQNKIIFTGFIKPQATRDYYDLADLLVFPSVWQEPSGLVLFEAWARGLPVLATQVGGVPELVKKYKHAQLISPKASPKLLAQKIETLLNKPRELKNLSKRGIEFIKNYGNFERMAREFEGVIESVKKC